MGSVWAEPARLALGITLLLGCARPTSAPPAPASKELELGRRFVAELPFRRAALEKSLAVTENGEARSRLAHYAQAGEWEALPILNAELAPVTMGSALGWARLWTGQVSWDEPALLALGQRAFEEWPAQRAPQLTPLLAASPTPATRRRLDSVGAWVDARGRVGGFVWARYPDGTTEPALSCASCHARPDSAGHLQHGPASDFDLGALVGEDWGPGRVDVTADARDNPVAIADLRATRHQQRLHHTGNLYAGLGALAVRTETLLITARDALVRPPREIAFALAYYVWWLGERSPGPEPAPSALFHENCGRCHSGATGAGSIVSAAELGIDAAAANSPLRGTGGYRAPSLYRVSQRRRLTHLGWELTLEQFLSPERLTTHPGHPFGLDLDAERRQALVRELAHW
ncbi:MAG TPA: hypothetical protein VJU61_08585 [Polyangiaceae bacterium]|nr:hypothetical protein [Polyangiaceae bacterium]